MKKSLLTLIICLSCLIAFAQKADSIKQDTTIQITMKLNQYRALMTTIDQNIDSKKASREILDFIARLTAVVPEQKKDSKK